jgi:hypothetical protein
MLAISQDFNKLDKIVSIVCCPTPNLVVKHCVYVKRKVSAKNKKDEERGYDFFYSYNGMNGLYLEAKGQIVFEGHRNIISSEGSTQYKKISCCIEMKDVANFLNRLDIVYSWLAGEDNKKIYLSDSQRRPCKIIDPSIKIVAALTQTSYVAFKPCIIRDMNDVAYEGVAMGNEQGEISNFTASEYSSFRLAMHSLLPNLYMANTMIINNAMQLCMCNMLYSKENNKDINI